MDLLLMGDSSALRALIREVWGPLIAQSSPYNSLEGFLEEVTSEN